MPSGPTIVQYGAFRATQDGPHLCGVWCDVIPTTASPVTEKLIGSGMAHNHAIMVAYALSVTNAGTSSFPLNEGKLI